VSGRLPGILLRLEGLAVAIAAIALYVDGDHSWWAFVLLVLAPDLSMLGYLGGVKVGAVAYDLAHTYALPIALATIGVLADEGACVAVALIWATHIGVDRTIGYGLKYPTRFKDTHLQRV